MSLPPPIDALWNELETARAELLPEVVGLSQRQADWKPGARDWSVGEILDHVTRAEVATGKLTTKLLKEAQAGGAPAVFPHDFTALPELPAWPPGPMEAPDAVWPEGGKPVGELVDGLHATRARSRQSVERLATCDPRPLVFKHFRLGTLDLAQWWRLTAAHDRVHLAQIRDVKATPGFPER
jgi:hypothetical protein